MIVNVLGQKVYGANGTLKKINHRIENIGKQLNSGTYFIELKGKDGAAFHKEIVKW